MVKIRLKRMGTTKRPFYRLVVADSRSPRDGRFIEALGYYDPLPQPASVKIDADRVREWLSRLRLRWRSRPSRPRPWLMRRRHPSARTRR